MSTRKRVAFVVNGAPGSPMSTRAESFARALGQDFDCELLHRRPQKVRAIAEMVSGLHALRPDAMYVMDLGYSGVAAAALHALRGRCPRVVDTGDAIAALARSVGGRGRVGELLTEALEQFGLRTADAIVVRGTFHQRLLSEQGLASTVIQDGVHVDAFLPRPAEEVRRKLGLEGVLTVGILGSSLWSERLQVAVGWELVELMRLLKGRPVKGVLIGDGSGVPHLRERCRRYGIEEQMRFIDRIPYESVPEYLRALDVVVSTQSNDVVGQVRTTGKLPLYMANGRYILATDVGEASLVLPEEMRVPYEGVVDKAYPARLAERVEGLLAWPERLRAGEALVKVAREKFDYAVLAGRVRDVLERVIR
ncbi:glycosyltransferase [Archangium violaceum]|uniref:glycosyltransferase n=1 Tax=Archangium violaceum TaxID=83451 RepID=UPI00193C1BBB|nr:glycosyltransferase [Archangium violaceum]QRK12687.1 glycosyltransferase [Archangium violaceum]